MRQKIGFIIVCYYTPLFRFRRLVRAIGKRPIVVVDNAEDEDKRIITMCKKRSYRVPPNVTFLTGTTNLGYASSVNVGLKYFFGKEYDWVVVINDDIICTKFGIDSFCRSLSKKSPGIVGIFQGYLDQLRYTTITRGDRFANLIKRMNPDYVSGSFWAIHKNVTTVAGFLYEPYFLYYEEADFCLRANKFGFPIQVVTNPAISHADATSLGESSYFHHYYLARNHFLFVERNAPVHVKIRELLRLPKTLYEHYSRVEEGALAGIRDYLFRRFGNAKKHV